MSSLNPIPLSADKAEKSGEQTWKLFTGQKRKEQFFTSSNDFGPTLHCFVIKLGCSFLFAHQPFISLCQLLISLRHALLLSLSSFSSLLCNLPLPLRCIQPSTTQGYHFKRLSIPTEETVKEHAAGHSCTSTLILSLPLTHTSMHARTN